MNNLFLYKYNKYKNKYLKLNKLKGGDYINLIEITDAINKQKLNELSTDKNEMNYFIKIVHNDNIYIYYNENIYNNYITQPLFEKMKFMSKFININLDINKKITFEDFNDYFTNIDSINNKDDEFKKRLKNNLINIKNNINIKKNMIYNEIEDDIKKEIEDYIKKELKIINKENINEDDINAIINNNENKFINGIKNNNEKDIINKIKNKIKNKMKDDIINKIINDIINNNEDEMKNKINNEFNNMIKDSNDFKDNYTLTIILINKMKDEILNEIKNKMIYNMKTIFTI